MAVPRKLEGVGEQVDENLSQETGVGDRRGQDSHADFQVATIPRRTQLLNHVRHQSTDINALSDQFLPAHAGETQ